MFLKCYVQLQPTTVLFFYLITANVATFWETVDDPLIMSLIIYYQLSSVTF